MYSERFRNITKIKTKHIKCGFSGSYEMVFRNYAIKHSVLLRKIPKKSVILHSQIYDSRENTLNNFKTTISYEQFHI